jgi:hypothetical protein
MDASIFVVHDEVPVVCSSRGLLLYTYVHTNANICNICTVFGDKGMLCAYLLLHHVIHCTLDQNGESMANVFQNLIE